MHASRASGRDAYTRAVSAIELLAVAVAGFACGGINAIAGGGSLVLFPVLLATGLPPLAANVTNTVAAWPGTVGGVAGFAPVLRGHWRRLLPMALAAVVGSAAGCALLLSTPASAFDVVVPVLVLGASLMLAIQPRVARRLGLAADERGGPVGAPAVVAVGIAGVYGGYFGGAMGVVLMAVLSFTVRDGLHRLNAFKGVLSFVDCSVGLVAFALFGPVSWAAVAAAAPPALIGGYLGARVARRIDERVLRASVVALGVVVAVWLAVR